MAPRGAMSDDWTNGRPPIRAAGMTGTVDHAEGRAVGIGPAFALMVGATLLLPVGDTLSKYLTGVVHPLEVTLWRLVFQALALGLAALVVPSRVHGRVFSPLLALGGLTTAATLGFLISAFAVMPIATAIAIFFVEPLLLTVMSALFLGERVGWRRYLAVVVGLLGAVVVIRPGWSTFGASALLPLGAAFAFAANMVVIRIASATRSGLGIQLGISVYAAALMAAAFAVAAMLGVVPWAGLRAPAFVWPVYGVMGVIAGVTFFMMAEAFGRAPASVLAPTQYFEIVGATALGYLVFGDFPEALTWLGTAIILASGLFVFHRERRAQGSG